MFFVSNPNGIDGTVVDDLRNYSRTTAKIGACGVSGGVPRTLRSALAMRC
jgi:coenzyme F420-reducing hydrogenase gamma subunit